MDANTARSYDATNLDRISLDQLAKDVAASLGGKPPSSSEVVNWVDEPIVEKRLGGFIKKKTTRRVEQRHTVTSPGSRWLLDQRYWIEKRPLQQPGDYGEESERYYYHLNWDGSLSVTTESNYDGIVDGRYFQGSRDESERAMNDSDILSFDYERRYFRDKSDFGIESTIMNGGLLVRAKGMGLSQVLRDLLHKYSSGSSR